MVLCVRVEEMGGEMDGQFNGNEHERGSGRFGRFRTPVGSSGNENDVVPKEARRN